MIFAGNASGFEVGLALGAASILSVGPNNLMMMREGITRGRPGFVASLVLSSYVSLITTSFLLSFLISQADPRLTTMLSVAGT